MSSPAEAAKAFHERVQESRDLLQISNSKLNGRVSSHLVPNKTSFQNLSAFQRIAVQEKCGDKSHLGTIDGHLCFSVNAAFKKHEPPASRKRKADAELEEAERAVNKVKNSGNGADKITTKSYSIATQAVSNLLKLKGASGESCVESFAVSKRQNGDYGAVKHEDGRPSLVVAARLTGGVAVPISSVIATFKDCPDGMLSTSLDGVTSDFDLPMSEECKTGHEKGQRSILLLASVPHVDETHETHM